MKSAAEIGSGGIIYKSSFMMTGAFALANVRGCNVGTTDGRDL
jgi:hypothetical protein